MACKSGRDRATRAHARVTFIHYRNNSTIRKIAVVSSSRKSSGARVATYGIVKVRAQRARRAGGGGGGTGRGAGKNENGRDQFARCGETRCRRLISRCFPLSLLSSLSLTLTRYLSRRHDFFLLLAPRLLAITSLVPAVRSPAISLSTRTNSHVRTNHHHHHHRPVGSRDPLIRDSHRGLRFLAVLLQRRERPSTRQSSA